MSFQNHYGLEVEDRFSDLMVKPKVKGYHRHTALHNNTIQYNLRNNLPIHSAQLPHAQQWTLSDLGAAIFETSNYNKNLTVSQKEILQWHFRIGNIGFSYVRFLSRTRWLPVNNPKAVVNFDKVKCEYCQFGKASRQPTKTQTVFKDKYKQIELKKNYLVHSRRVSVDYFQSALPGWLYN